MGRLVALAYDNSCSQYDFYMFFKSTEVLAKNRKIPYFIVVLETTDTAVPIISVGVSRSLQR